jgi:hypothetical protein
MLSDNEIRLLQDLLQAPESKKSIARIQERRAEVRRQQEQEERRIKLEKTKLPDCLRSMFRRHGVASHTAVESVVEYTSKFLCFTDQWGEERKVVLHVTWNRTIDTIIKYKVFVPIDPAVLPKAWNNRILREYTKPETVQNLMVALMLMGHKAWLESCKRTRKKTQNAL